MRAALLRSLVVLLLPLLTIACSAGSVKLDDSESPWTPDSGDDSGASAVDDSGPAADSDSGDDSGPPDTGEPVESVPGAPQTQGWEHLPVLIIETDGRLTEDTKVDGTLAVITDHDGTLTDLGPAPRAFTSDIGIEVHGRSTSSDPKHAYRLELRDEAGEDLDTPLLGLANDSDYVLFANYGDKTYLRNPFSFWVAGMLAESTGAWQPRWVFVEVYLDGDYQGVYTLIDRVKIDGSKLDLPTPATTAAEGDLSGGYVFKLDAGSGDYFTTAQGTIVEHFDPRNDEISAEQRVYVRDWLDQMETVLVSDEVADPTTGYPAWMDVASWVDLVLVHELAHNIDAYRLSTYPFKAADADGGLLHGGPVWDFDRAYGNVNYCDGWKVSGWVYDDIDACGYAYQYALWFPTLFDDPAFQDALTCRWEELRATQLTDEAITAWIDARVAELAEAEPRDHELWGNIGVDVGFNYYVGETWQEDLDWFEDWVLARVKYMDDNMWGTCGG